MKKKISKSLLMTALITGLCFGGVQGVFAAEDLNTFALDEYVVTATRTLEQAIKIPAMVNVVTAEDIKEKNINTITDAVKMLPGVYDARPGGMSDVANGIQIRGFGESDILVLYDGMPMNDGFNGSANWSAISIEDVKRIEVVKGAASSLYGGRAVGAVINIIGKDTDKDSVRAYMNYGSDSTWKRGINLNKKINDKWSLGIGYENKETDGHLKKLVHKKQTSSNMKNQNDYDIVTGGKLDKHYDGSDTVIAGTPGTGASENHTYNVKLKYKFDEEKALTYRYTHDEFEYFAVDPVSYLRDANGNPVFNGSVKLSNGKFINFSEGDFTDSDGRREIDRHALQYKDEENKINFNIGITDVKDYGYASGDDFAGTGEGTDARYPNKTYKADFQKVWENNKNTFVAGFDFEKSSLDYSKADLKHWGNKNSVEKVTYACGGEHVMGALFAQNQYKFNDEYGVIVGLRLDHYEKKNGYSNDFKSPKQDLGEASYSELSPKIAFEYTPDNTTTYYVSYGHSFNAPTLYQLYRSNSSYIANPELDPETTDTFELGIKKNLNEKTYLGLAVYKAKTTDMISDKKVGSYKQYQNINEAERIGTELELRHHFDKELSGYFNYTWQKAEDGDNERIYSVPKHLLHAGLQYKKDKFGAYIEGQYVSSRNEPGDLSGKYLSEDSFFTANVGVNYKIMKNATLTFAVDNLFDKDYWQWYKAAGRTIMTGVQFEF